MAAGVAKLQLSAHPFNHLGSRDLSRSDRRPRLRSDPHRNQVTFDGVSFLGPLLCRRRGIALLSWRSFRSENGGESSSERDGRGEVVPEERASQCSKRKGGLYSLKSLLVRVSGGRAGPGGQYRKAVEKAEEIFFSVSCSPSSLLLQLKRRWFLKGK